jgi:L-fuculose-phosphate aldolase
MHRAVYAAEPQARAVLHTSAPYTTLLACSRLRVPVNMNTDAMAYVGRVLRVPYRHPGTRELAAAAAAQARRARALLLSNHGSLVWDVGLDAVLRRTEALEFVARLVVTARSARVPLAALSADDVARFRGHDPY